MGIITPTGFFASNGGSTNFITVRIPSEAPRGSRRSKQEEEEVEGRGSRRRRRRRKQKEEKAGAGRRGKGIQRYCWTDDACRQEHFLATTT